MRVYRQSPFSKKVEFEVELFKNQYIGSGRAILRKIALMDNQKQDIAGLVEKVNKGIRDNERRIDKNMHKDVADLIMQDKIII